MTDPEDNAKLGIEPTPPRKSWIWRLFRGFVGLATIGLVVVILAAIMLRLYFNDERLRSIVEATLAERTQTAALVQGLELELFSGLALTGISLGTPRDFHDTPIQIGRLEARYEPWGLLTGVVRIPVVEIANISIVIEEDESGRRNLDAILTALFPPQGEAQKTPAPDSSTSPIPELPQLPLDVDVERLLVGPVDLTMKRPGMTVFVDEIRGEARADIDGDAYSADLWIGLGERESDVRASSVTVVRNGQPALSSSQRLSLDFGFNGFDDIQLAMRFDGRTDAEAPVDAPPIDSGITLKAHADLLAQTASVDSMSLTVGSGTELTLGADASELFGVPIIALQKLEFRSDLAELSPMIQAAVPSAKASGTVSLRVAPTSVSGSALQSLSTLRTEAVLSATDLSAQYAAHRMDDLDGEIRVKLQDDEISGHAKLALASASSGAIDVSRSTLDLKTTSSLTRWLASETSTPDLSFLVSAKSSLSIEELRAGALGASALRTTFDVLGPVDLLRGAVVDLPLEWSLSQEIGRMRLPGQRIAGTRFDAKGHLFDLLANRADTNARLRIKEIVAKLGENETMRVPSVAATLSLSRNDQRIRVPELRATAGSMFQMSGSFDLDDALTPSPLIRKFEFLVEPFQLKELMALVPVGVRPQQQVEGQLFFDAGLSGRIPVAALKRAFTLPKLDTAWPERVESIRRFLEGLAGLFESGLPFSGHVGLETNNVSIRDSGTDVAGLSVDLDLNALESGPRFELAFLLDEMKAPSTLADLDVRASIEFNRRSLSTETFVRLGRYQDAFLPKPLKNATLEWRAVYDVGGALVLERLEALAPDRDGRFSLTMVMQDPLRVLRDRSYATRGMPGVDVTSQLDARFRIGEDAPLQIPGITVNGGLGLSAQMNVHDGVIDGMGSVSASKLSMENETVVVSDVDGSLPFELSLATRPMDGYVSLPQRMPLGDGQIRIGVQSDRRVASSRPLYFPRTRRYRSERGIRVRSIYSQGFEMEYLEIEGGLRAGAIEAERARFSILGGDIEGSMAVRLNGERSVKGTIDLKLSNLDASYFPALDLEPGGDSELDADASLAFALAPERRDLTASMNVTRISTNALDRFLQLLDPTEQNEAIQRTRFYLDLAQINGVAMWLAYENLNMDLDANSIIKIPFTDIGVPNFERELLRRESMSERLDIYWYPFARRVFGPIVGDTGAH